MTMVDTLADEHYGSREKLAFAFAAILNQEARELAALESTWCSSTSRLQRLFRRGARLGVAGGESARGLGCRDRGAPSATARHRRPTSCGRSRSATSAAIRADLPAARAIGHQNRYSLECANSRVPIELIRAPRGQGRWSSPSTSHHPRRIARGRRTLHPRGAEARAARSPLSCAPTAAWCLCRAMWRRQAPRVGRGAASFAASSCEGQVKRSAPTAAASPRLRFGPVRRAGGAIHDRDRLLEDRRGPCDVFQPVGRRRDRHQVRAHLGKEVASTWECCAPSRSRRRPANRDAAMRSRSVIARSHACCASASSIACGSEKFSPIWIGVFTPREPRCAAIVVVADRFLDRNASRRARGRGAAPRPPRAPGCSRP